MIAMIIQRIFEKKGFGKFYIFYDKYIDVYCVYEEQYPNQFVRVYTSDYYDDCEEFVLDELNEI